MMWSWDSLGSLCSCFVVFFVGDPCLFKKELPTGKVVYCAVYVDDLTYAVSDQGTADSFLADIRQRFEVAEDQGKPIDF